MKKIGIFIVSIALVFILTGCGNKTAITSDDFKTISESQGYSVVDITNQYASYGYINSGQVAQSKDGYQVEFYVVSDESQAISSFNKNKSNFETYKGNSSKELNVSIGNYSTYSLTSSGYYMYLSRVDNTIIYLRVQDTYKKQVEKLIKELGY